jgi:hypothetical protein
MILIGLDHKVTRFGRKRFILWRGRKLPDAPNASIPPKMDRVSPWLSNVLQKTANKIPQKMPKMTLGQLRR